MGKHEIFAVKHIGRDGCLTTEQVITDPLFQRLLQEKTYNNSPSPITYIDGQPFHVRLLAGGTHPGAENEWDRFKAASGHNNDLIHYDQMYSWCLDVPNGNPSSRVGQGATWTYDTASSESPCMGFRPVLEPLDPDTLHPCSNRFQYIQEGSRIQMGALYMDDQPQCTPLDPTSTGDIPDYKAEASLRIGDSTLDSSKHIRWIKWGDLFVCDRNLVKNISWDDLNRQGLVYGTSRSLRPHPSMDELIEQAEQSKLASNNKQSEKSRSVLER